MILITREIYLRSEKVADNKIGKVIHRDLIRIVEDKLLRETWLRIRMQILFQY